MIDLHARWLELFCLKKNIRIDLQKVLFNAYYVQIKVIYTWILQKAFILERLFMLKPFKKKCHKKFIEIHYFTNFVHIKYYFVIFL